jgi:predicted nucleic acid-binding protein
LVDTCAWSLLLRRKTKARMSHDEQLMLAALIAAIEDGRIAIIGPIRQEVLSGIRDKDQFEKLRTALEPFRDEQLTTAHFEAAARFFNLCRGQGVECDATDVLICSVAAREKWTVLTSDRGLKRCMQALRADGFMK